MLPGRVTGWERLLGGGSWMSMLLVHWSGPGYKELCLVHAYMSPWPPAVASYSVLG